MYFYHHLKNKTHLSWASIKLHLVIYAFLRKWTFRKTQNLSCSRISAILSVQDFSLPFPSTLPHGLNPLLPAADPQPTPWVGQGSVQGARDWQCLRGHDGAEAALSASLPSQPRAEAGRVTSVPLWLFSVTNFPTHFSFSLSNLDISLKYK